MTDSASAVQQTLADQPIRLVMVYVDFADGRLQPGNVVPTGGDTSSPGLNLDAVGGMGWEKDAAGLVQKKLRKYVYEDYWNKVFSAGVYNDDAPDGVRHPDSASHGTRVYGSVKDYYLEATHGHVSIIPEQTWPGADDMYHTGIANAYDEADGNKYLRWIMLPYPRSYYSKRTIGSAVTRELRRRRELPATDPDYIDFNLYAYSGYLGVVVSGYGRGIAGFASAFGGHEFYVSEKTEDNSSPQSIISGIGEMAHELGHSLGLPHTGLGSYDLMHWGGFGAAEHYFCPPHFNPWTKLMRGWIPGANVRVIDDGGAVSLPAITDSAVVGIVKTSGEPGETTDWNQGEYYIIEYRARTGFNRFAGGVSAPGFTGGALIWWHTPAERLIVDPIQRQFNSPVRLMVAGYDASFKGNAGSPRHFYPPQTATDSTGAGAMNIYAIAGERGGIVLNGFSIAGERLTFTAVTAVEDSPAEPEGFLLEQNYPNPFNPRTHLQFTIAPLGAGAARDFDPAGLNNLSRSSRSSEGEERDERDFAPAGLSTSQHVTLKVYNVLGEEVATLVNEEKEPGQYTVEWDAGGLPSGAYYCRLTAGTLSEVRQMLLVK